MAGGVLSPHRDLVLITALVQLVRSCARSLATLVCVDGLASYVATFRWVFRYPVRTGALPQHGWRPTAGTIHPYEHCNRLWHRPRDHA
jgi:hypothetical protein